MCCLCLRLILWCLLYTDCGLLISHRLVCFFRCQCNLLLTRAIKATVWQTSRALHGQHLCHRANVLCNVRPPRAACSAPVMCTWKALYRASTNCSRHSLMSRKHPSHLIVAGRTGVHAQHIRPSAGKLVLQAGLVALLCNGCGSRISNCYLQSKSFCTWNRSLCACSAYTKGCTVMTAASSEPCLDSKGMFLDLQTLKLSRQIHYRPIKRTWFVLFHRVSFQGVLLIPVLKLSLPWCRRAFFLLPMSKT